MNKKEKLALFLGMLSGDGCLPFKHNSEGYKNYAVQFYNTNENIVRLFTKLFSQLFNLECKFSYRDRINRKRIFEVCKYSKKVVLKLKKLGFPEGVKRDVLRILPIIKIGSDNQKLAFIYGFLITDGCIRKKGDILFHSGSKLFLEDLSLLISEFTGKKKPIREYVQREVYHSYQLNLNMSETRELLSAMPLWDNGTPLVLS